jgi:hypothetical protein
VASGLRAQRDALLSKLSHLTLRSAPQDNNQGSKRKGSSLQLAGNKLELVFGSAPVEISGIEQAWQPAVPKKMAVASVTLDRAELDHSAAQAMAADVLHAPLPSAVGVTRLVV